MKQDTKELIEWIICQIKINKDISHEITVDATEKYKETKNKALAFLDSLPEIESHLCRGGYIQDKNGTPCCDGDKVIVVVQNFVDVLRWDIHDKKFVVTDDTNYAWTLGNWEFEKVE